MKNLLSKPVLLSLIIVFCVALGLRLINLQKSPPSIYWDEAAIALDAVSVAKTGKDIHSNSWFQAIYPSYGDFKQPIYILAVVPFTWLSSWVEWTAIVRLPNALAGVATVFITLGIFYRLAGLDLLKEKIRAKVVLLAGLMISVIPWSLHFSRTGFEAYFGQMLLGLSLLLLIWPKKIKLWHCALSAVIAALATYSYFSIRFVWPGVVLIFFLVKFWQKFDFGSKIKVPWKILSQFATTIFVFSLLLIPMFNSDYYNATQEFRLSTKNILTDATIIEKSNQLKATLPNTLGSKLFASQKWLTFDAFLKHFSDHLTLDYLFFTGDPNLRHSTGNVGILFLSFLPLLILGGYRLIKTQPSWLFFLIIWWSLSLVPASIPYETPHALRSLNALIPLSLILMFGVKVVIEFLEKSKDKMKLLIIGFFVLIFIFEFSSYFYNYHKAYPITSAPDWQGGYSELVELIATNDSNDTKVYINNFDDRFFLWYFLYQGIDPEEIQLQESQGFKFKYLSDQIDFDLTNADKINSLEPYIIAGKTSAMETTGLNSNLIKISHPSKEIDGKFSIIKVKP